MHHCVTVGYGSRRRTRKEPFGRKVSADAQRVELSGPPAVIAKYWCLPDAIGHAKPIFGPAAVSANSFLGLVAQW
jgi:hypothetical protein